MTEDVGYRPFRLDPVNRIGAVLRPDAGVEGNRTRLGEVGAHEMIPFEPEQDLHQRSLVLERIGELHRADVDTLDAIGSVPFGGDQPGGQQELQTQLDAIAVLVARNALSTASALAT